MPENHEVTAKIEKTGKNGYWVKFNQKKFVPVQIMNAIRVKSFK